MEYLRKKTIELYGGYDFWNNAKTLTAIVSVNGLLFKMKRRQIFKNVKVEIDLNKFYSKITPIGENPNISGVFDYDRVYLIDNLGNIISERKDPRKYFPYNRRLFYWDDLDMAYFANYAFWNYFAFPKILINEEIKWLENGNSLEAIFPDNFPTHSKKQTFIFDRETGLLKQHNYTAEVVSGLATAANVIKEHKTENGIIYASHRIVTPQSKKNGFMKFPVLVNDIVHSITIV